MKLKLSEKHDCEKNRKQLEIEMDILGFAYCGYCHRRVNYSELSHL